jgi:hypothetical protein
VVTAQYVPNRLDRIVSPHQRNGIGRIRIADKREALAVKLVEAKVTDRDNGFDAQLVVEHGPGLMRAELRYVSHADGRFEMSERLVALQDVTTAEIGTGLIGILNNPLWIYESGQRRVTVDDRTTIVASTSGTTIDAAGCRQLDIDSVLRATGSQPLLARYAAAADYERARVTDQLYLNHIADDHTWKQGEVVSEYKAVIDVTPHSDASTHE